MADVNAGPEQTGLPTRPGQAPDWYEQVVVPVRRILSGPDGPLLLALVLAVASVLEVRFYLFAGIGDGGDATIAYLTNLVATVPLVLIRKHLRIAAAIITLSTLVIAADPNAMFTISGLGAQLIAVYFVALRDPRWVSVLFTIPFLVNAAVPLSGGDPGGPDTLVLILVVACQVLGIAHRQRGQAIAERDASRQAMAESVREQIAMGERARIARELHDVVAHHLSMIAVQAETARLTTVGLPDDGRRRFSEISATARDALTEMRRLLGVLRSDAAAEADRSPQPGLDNLVELIVAARAAGTDIRLVLEGDVVPLPPGVDLSAYRIVQEALTNARRHAPDAAVIVELRYAPDLLRLRVRDSGPGPAPGTVEGHGLLGMRERAAMVGGTLRWGPADGGFAVEAELPVTRQVA
jgi:signal transduction histidine kinase